MLPIGHTREIVSAEFSPDGQKIVTASADGTVKIWNTNSGELLNDLNGHLDMVRSAEFSQDEKKIVTFSFDKTVKIWDAISGKLLTDLKNFIAPINSAEFSPNGKQVVTASLDKTAKIWDATSGNLLVSLKGHTDWVSSAEFSPDGKKVVTASHDKTAKIWDAISGKLLTTLKGHTDWVSAKFNPDGKKIVTNSFDKTAKIWDANSGKLLATLSGHADYVTSVQISPDDKKIVTTSGLVAKIWDAVTGNLVTTLTGPVDDRILSAQFSPDSKKIISFSFDNNVNVWDVDSGKLLFVLYGHTDRIHSAQYSPDGKKIVTSSYDKTAKIWDAESGDLLVNLKGRIDKVFSAQFSRDGEKIVTASDNNTAKIWDVASGEFKVYLKGHTDIIESAQFSPNGTKIVTASQDNTSKIWDAESGNLLVNLKGHTEGVYSACFSNDGKSIATASFDETIKIWDVDSGNLLASLNNIQKWLEPSTQLSLNWKRFLSESSNRIRVVDVDLGNEIASLEDPTAAVTASAQFSSDGNKIVTASWDNTGKIWDAASGKLLIKLKGHTNWVQSAQFSEDGKKVATISDDNTCKVWDAVSGKLLADLKGHRAKILSVQFSPDIRTIVTSSIDNTLKIWDISTGKIIKDYYLGANTILSNINFNKDLFVAINNNAGTIIFSLKDGQCLYSFYEIDSAECLVMDSAGRYDGSSASRKLLYFTCETETIKLDQLKDQLWVPNLAERIMKGETINAKTIDELDICGLTPEVEDANENHEEYIFKIKPRRGGLGKTVLLINGIEAISYQPEELTKVMNGYELRVRKSELQSFFIPGMQNPVALKVYIKDSTISSRGINIIENKAKETTLPPNLFCVMIGVTDYKGDELDLKYAAKDATDISNTIAISAKKLLNVDGNNHVLMYNLTTNQDRYLTPEKKSIKKTLEEIGKKATANDILLIFFAGHGVMEGETKQFYFLTADASKASATSAITDVGISTIELSEWMKPQNIKAQKRILIFDACNSGQAINDFVKMGTGDQHFVAARSDAKAQQIKAIDKLNEKSGLFILSASASNQNAYEMGRYSQGLLTYSLLKAIKQQPDILEDGKYLNVSRWFNAAEKTVSDLSKENGARQEPQIVSNSNFNIGIVDEEVMAKIILPQEKPLFAACNFQNNDERITDDDLELSKMVNLELSDLASRGTESKIVYVTSTNSSDAYSLSGRYIVSGNTIKVTVNVKQKKVIISKFEINGTKDRLKELVKSIVEKAAGIVK